MNTRMCPNSIENKPTSYDRACLQSLTVNYTSDAKKM